MSDRTYQLERGGYGVRDAAQEAPRPVTGALLMTLLQLAVVLFLASLVATAGRLDVPASAFMRDPAAIAGINPLNGMVSQLGAMLWSATVAITWFTAWLLRPGTGRGLFLYFGAFTALLLVDDVFMVHDEILPNVLSLPEEPVYMLYGTILLYGLLRYRHALRWRTAPLLAIACVCFAVAAGVDVLIESGEDWVYWIEDGAKLLGIANWCACFAVLAASALQGEQPARGGAPWAT